MKSAPLNIAMNSLTWCRIFKGLGQNHTSRTWKLSSMDSGNQSEIQKCGRITMHKTDR